MNKYQLGQQLRIRASEPEIWGTVSEVIEESGGYRYKLRHEGGDLGYVYPEAMLEPVNPCEIMPQESITRVSEDLLNKLDKTCASIKEAEEILEKWREGFPPIQEYLRIRNKALKKANDEMAKMREENLKTAQSEELSEEEAQIWLEVLRAIRKLPYWRRSPLSKYAFTIVDYAVLKCLIAGGWNTYVDAEDRLQVGRIKDL